MYTALKRSCAIVEDKSSLVIPSYAISRPCDIVLLSTSFPATKDTTDFFLC